ncbi:MAG: hypothetical protein HOP25_05605 [Methylotenera sp.]|nr:hypothetical protein [Methylotenera sp.]
MRALEEQITKANRLQSITQKVGFALWQLQELEGVAAQYFVLIAQAKQGMGIEAGLELTGKALGKTFGLTITNLAKSNLLSNEIESKFQAILTERNWLVHNSRASSRNSIHDEVAYQKLMSKLDTLKEQTLLFLKEIEGHMQQYVEKHGVNLTQIDEIAARTIQEWHNNVAL